MEIKGILLVAVIMATTITLNAQKKVAVWETKCGDNSISSFQSTMVRGGMETAVANAIGYTGYDRTAFDAILKEHNFQRSGSVKDSDIKRLGEMAGVQYIIVPEANADGSNFYIIVKILDVETGEFGAAYDVLCGNSVSDIRTACSELGNKLFGGYGIINGHEFVDLELQSGTLWATCNVGAKTPEEYGCYYAWGETKTKKMTFEWRDYKYANGNYDKLTKYCTGNSCGNDGFTDGLTILQSGDDAATANWGGSWHTPSKAQWDELMQNTSYKMVVQNGVNGVLFTASNGKSLFLPAAGACLTFPAGQDFMGLYWSNSLNYGKPYSAWYFIFNFGNNSCETLDRCGSGRSSGFSVRPVCDK